jgi:neuronal PAS domain-containing protein 1/3
MVQFFYVFPVTRPRAASGLALDIFEQHQGTHILQVSETKPIKLIPYIMTNIPKPNHNFDDFLHFVFQSLDGFAFTLGADGRFLYVSETVSIYLGLSQVKKIHSSTYYPIYD